MYYDKDEKGISSPWIETIKNCVANVACNFTTNRMMEDYIRQYYVPLAKRSSKMVAKEFAMAKEIAQWKDKMRGGWHNIEVVSASNVDNVSGALLLNNEYKAEISLRVGDIDPQDLGIELLLAEPNKKGKLCIKEVFEYKFKECTDGVATYKCKIVPDKTGAYQSALRMYAKNKQLPHRQDFELVRWL
jgi:phosphorylase/glycogen(starch) synthase